MPNASSHLPKEKPSSSRRCYYGETDSTPVVVWLNEMADTPHGKRIVGLIADLVKLCHSVRPRTVKLISSRDWEAIEARHPEATGMRLHDVAVKGWVESSTPLTIAEAFDSEASQRVEKQLSRYTFTPTVIPFLPGQNQYSVSIDWMPAIRLKSAIRMTAADKARLRRAQEAQVVRHLVELVRVGLVDRVRRCACSRWFFAKFKHGRFCSTKCQQKDYHGNEQWKEHRRKQRRENYRLHKLGIVKEKGV